MSSFEPHQPADDARIGIPDDALTYSAEQQWLPMLVITSLVKHANGDALNDLERLLVSAVDRSGLEPAVVGRVLRTHFVHAARSTLTAGDAALSAVTVGRTSTLPAIASVWNPASATLVIEAVEHLGTSAALVQRRAAQTPMPQGAVGGDGAERYSGVQPRDLSSAFVRSRLKVTIVLVRTRETSLERVPNTLPTPFSRLKTMRFHCEQETVWNWMEPDDNSWFFYGT